MLLAGRFGPTDFRCNVRAPVGTTVLYDAANPTGGPEPVYTSGAGPYRLFETRGPFTVNLTGSDFAVENGPLVVFCPDGHTLTFFKGTRATVTMPSAGIEVALSVGQVTVGDSFSVLPESPIGFRGTARTPHYGTRTDREEVQSASTTVRIKSGNASTGTKGSLMTVDYSPALRRTRAYIYEQLAPASPNDVTAFMVVTTASSTRSTPLAAGYVASQVGSQPIPTTQSVADASASESSLRMFLRASRAHRVRRPATKPRKP